MLGFFWSLFFVGFYSPFLVMYFLPFFLFSSWVLECAFRTWVVAPVELFLGIQRALIWIYWFSLFLKCIYGSSMVVTHTNLIRWIVSHWRDSSYFSLPGLQYLGQCIDVHADVLYVDESRTCELIRSTQGWIDPHQCIDSCAIGRRQSNKIAS